MGQPVVHFEILGEDAIGLQKFYADLFDWNIAPPMSAEMGNYAVVDRPSSGVGGGIGQPAPGDKPRVTVYVAVPDLQAALDQAVALGGKIVSPPMVIPGVVSMAHFSDPAGNVIGLVIPEMPPA